VLNCLKSKTSGRIEAFISLKFHHDHPDWQIIFVVQTGNSENAIGINAPDTQAMLVG